MTVRILNAYADRRFLDDTVVAVLADHGHMRIDAAVPTDVAERFGALPYGRLALAPRAFSNDEMRMLLTDPRVEDVYAREELELLGAWDPAWGERVVALTDGLMFPHPRGMKMLGYHGGLMESEWHIPLILAGPGVTAGARLDECEIIDLAPTLSILLGGTPPQQTEGRVLWEILDTRRLRSVEGYVRLWREKYALLAGWQAVKRGWARREISEARFEREQADFRERVDAHAAALKRAKATMSP